ncbi:MAG: glycosyltransferase [Bacteroidota bacterium]
MKILQVSLGKQEDIREALATLGDVIYWDWSGRNMSFNRDIRNLVDTHRPDIIFLQLQTDGIIDKHTAAYISQKSFTINWTGDVRSPLPQWFKDIAPHIGVTLFTNMNDVDQMRAMGFRADYMQIGFPTKIFNSKAKAVNVPDIIFMGNNVGGFPLSSMRKQMVDILKQKYGNRFAVYGVGYPGSNYIPLQTEEVKHYRGCKVAINISHFNFRRYSSDRIFRLMGSGAFCLSHHYQDIEKDFEIGAHLDVWKNFEELTSKIDYYLKNEDIRKCIAKTGCEHVHKNHTWMNRIDDLKALLPKHLFHD